MVTDVIAVALHPPSAAVKVYEPVAAGVTCIITGFSSVEVNASGPVQL
jgi:hypothetical protein